MKKTAIALAFGAISVSVQAVVPWEHNASIAALTSESATATAKIQADVSTTTVNITKTINQATDAMNAAIKAAISQEAMTATQIANADLEIRKMHQQAESEAKKAKKAFDIMRDYGSKTGQGYKVCVVTAENEKVYRMIGDTKIETTRVAQRIDNGAGKLAKSASQVYNEREQKHRELACTQAEYNAGQCKVVSDNPAGDSNAAILFETTEKGSDTNKLQDMVRENILGTPDIAIPSGAGKTVQGQAYLYNTNRKTALQAFPAYSLAYIQAMSEIDPNLKDVDGNPTSPNDMIFKTVTRYYGSKEAEEWTKAMIAQRPRGTLVEMAKMEGLGAWLDFQELQGLQRMEGILASLTVAAAMPLEQRLIQQQRKLGNATTAIKVVGE